MGSQPARPGAPVVGFNHNVSYRGRTFHVQTEDSGPQHGHVITHVFIGGNILASSRRSYAELVGITAPDVLSTTVRRLMEEQHKQLMKSLIGGAYDAEIARRTGGPVYEPGVLAGGERAPGLLVGGQPRPPVPPARPMTPPPSARPATPPPMARPATPPPMARPMTPPPPRPVMPGVPPLRAAPPPPSPLTALPSEPTPRLPRPPLARPLARPVTPAPRPPPAPTRPMPDPAMFGDKPGGEPGLDEIILSYLATDLGTNE